MMNWRRRFFRIMLVIGAGLAVWAFYVEPASFRIQKETVVIPSWPNPCVGLTVAVLADLHVGSPYKGLNSLRELVREVNAASPDLILLPGDFVIQDVVGGSFVAPEDAGAVLVGLQAPMGVFAVLGNHDWWLSAKRVEQALTAHNITVLEDKSQIIADGSGCQLRLVGISDYWEGPHDVVKAVQDVRPDDYVIAFTHNPDVFPALPTGTALTIAGHTHGGQVYLPGLGRLVVPSAFGEQYAIGHVVENGRHLYVSPGVGTSILPVRFLVPPEVTLLQITNTTKHTP